MTSETHTRFRYAVIDVCCHHHKMIWGETTRPNNFQIYYCVDLITFYTLIENDITRYFRS